MLPFSCGGNVERRYQRNVRQPSRIRLIPSLSNLLKLLDFCSINSGTGGQQRDNDADVCAYLLCWFGSVGETGCDGSRGMRAVDFRDFVDG